MFDSTVTLFNHDEYLDKYYSTVFLAAEFQPNFKTSFDSSATLDGDTCLVVINYTVQNGEKRVNGTDKPFKSPKIWEILPKEQKSQYFTLKTGRDFFALGDYSNSESVDYEIFKDGTDNVFFIGSFKDFEYELPHFEITGY